MDAENIPLVGHHILFQAAPNQNPVQHTAAPPFRHASFGVHVRLGMSCGITSILSGFLGYLLYQLAKGNGDIVTTVVLTVVTAAFIKLTINLLNQVHNGRIEPEGPPPPPSAGSQPA